MCRVADGGWARQLQRGSYVLRGLAEAGEKVGRALWASETQRLRRSLVAQARGLKVRAITLFALGGVSQIQDDAKTELLVAIAGPIASLIISFGCLAIALGLGWHRSIEPETAVVGVLVWLGYINIALAVFNMIPGFPLDGVPVLRAIV